MAKTPRQQYREQRRKEARESSAAVHDLVREPQGKEPAKRVKLSEALPEDHAAAMRREVILVNDGAEDDDGKE